MERFDEETETRRRRVLFLLDEFPALGRLEFFESALAFMAGYGLKAFLITQSLNQVEKAYGATNAILDNCHVRVAFAANDERTAKRISDALGTKTEQRAMQNFAGSRLAPMLMHRMVSRQETARQLLTPGEVMQLPASDELVLVAGFPPILARKLRYYKDRNFTGRLKAPPLAGTCLPPVRSDDWGKQVRALHEDLLIPAEDEGDRHDQGDEGPGVSAAGATDTGPRPIAPRPTRPTRTSRPKAPLQAGLFDGAGIADGFEETTGIDLTGRRQR
jgi:type IV secretion system protein VirD4